MSKKDHLSQLFDEALKAYPKKFKNGDKKLNDMFNALSNILNIKSELKNKTKPEKALIITDKLRSVSGHSVINLLRTFGAIESLSYKDIIVDCCNNLKIAVGRKGIKTLENEIAEKMLNSIWNKLNKKQKDDLIKKMKKEAEKRNISNSIAWGDIAKGTTPIATLLIMGNAGFGVYIAAVTSLSAISSALGLSLGFGAYTSLTSGLSVALGPVGIIISGIWAAYMFGSPNYQKKVIPCILIFSMIRNEIII